MRSRPMANAALMRRSIIRRSRSNEFQFDKAGEELDMITPLSSTEPSLFVVFPKDGRQLQLLELVVQQDLRCVRHDAPPAAERHM